jgi:phosphate transport system permease protein
MTNIQKRKLAQFIGLSLSTIAALVGMFWLIYILSNVLYQGINYINIDLFIKDPVAPGDIGGGLRHAFVGQAMLTLGSIILGVPIGVLGGTFISEYGRHSKIASFISILSDIMTSVPSIVIGTFVYALLVLPFNHFNGYAGSVALAILMIPVIIRTTENMMRLVPWSLREAAFALGSPYWKVIIQIVYKGAITGISTGILLAVARVAGETAPLLFTSFNNDFFTTNMSEPIPSLTVTIYQYAGSPYDDWVQKAWAASFVITFLILIITLIVRFIIKLKYKNN